jgi:hypothetical protein
MKKQAYLGAVLAGLSMSLAGCQRAERPSECLLVESDFEQFEGWVAPLPAVLSTEHVHSGRYAEHLADGMVYGPPHLTKLAKCDFVPRRLRLQAWVYLPSGRIRSTNIIVEIDCHGRRPNIWTGLEIEQAVRRYQKWERVQKYIHLPADMEASDELKMYLWHPETNGENLWLDDIQLIGER